MKTILLSILLLATTAQAADFLDVEYVRNYDGDTITVNIYNVPPILGRKIGIRVNGIDTPEIRGKCAKEKALAYEAKAYVGDVLKKAETINLRNISRGKYFRIVADVDVDGVDLAAELLRKKLAVPYNGGHKSKDWCN